MSNPQPASFWRLHRCRLIAALALLSSIATWQSALAQYQPSDVPFSEEMVEGECTQCGADGNGCAEDGCVECGEVDNGCGCGPIHKCGILGHLFDDLFTVPSMYALSGLYVKAGVAVPTGGFFTSNSAGWTGQLGVRQRLGCDPNHWLFFDLGGSLLNVSGSRTEATPGSFQVSQNGTSIATGKRADLYNSTLRNVTRLSVDVALGTYFQPFRAGGWLSRNSICHVRGGGRFGHITGHFENTPTADTRALITAASAAGATVALNRDFGKTDSFGGTFIGIGWNLVKTVTDPRFPGTPTYMLGVEAEYGHDWVQLRNFASGGLDTMSITLTGTALF